MTGESYANIERASTSSIRLMCSGTHRGMKPTNRPVESTNDSHTEPRQRWIGSGNRHWHQKPIAIRSYIPERYRPRRFEQGFGRPSFESAGGAHFHRGHHPVRAKVKDLFAVSTPQRSSSTA